MVYDYYSNMWSVYHGIAEVLGMGFNHPKATHTFILVDILKLGHAPYVGSSCWNL